MVQGAAPVRPQVSKSLNVSLAELLQVLPVSQAGDVAARITGVKSHIAPTKAALALGKSRILRCPRPQLAGWKG